MKYLYISLIIIALSLILAPLIIALFLFRHHLVKTKKDKWGRVCSSKSDIEQINMWNKGLSYLLPYKNNIEEINITNDNLNLKGEIINQHSKKSVIILGGRCECLYYSYYYAKEYLDEGFNVIVIDPRAHGQSEGRYNTVGFKEANDLKAWINYLKEKYGLDYFILHGICIGGATITHLCSMDDCPKEVKKIFIEGVFRNFYEAYKAHMKVMHGPTFPTLPIIFWYFKIINKCDAKKEGPINWIKKVKVPTLILSGKEDIFVNVKVSQELYNLCGSKQKYLYTLPKGNHSHLRINQEEKYDELIYNFINEQKEV